MPLTNITMLCANRPKLLRQALDSIGDISNATLTIRDAGMDPDVFAVANEWFLKNDRTAKNYFLAPAPAGTGEARNSVIETAQRIYGRGEFLYLSDDDVCFTRPDWLKILIGAYESAWQEGFRVIGAYNHPYHIPISYCAYPGGFVVTEVQALALQSMLMRWEVWDKYGPFKETPIGAVCQGEDVDFGNKIKEDGGRLGVVYPALLVNCGLTNSFGKPIPGYDLVKSQIPPGIFAE